MKVDFSCKGEYLTFGDNFNKWYSYGRWQFLWEQVCCDKKKNKRNNTYKYIYIFIKFLFLLLVVLMRKLPSAITVPKTILKLIAKPQRVFGRAYLAL